MPGRTVLATLGGRGPSQRLQVSLSQGDDGRLLIDLREQHHAEGIGWFDQRRLELDPRQFQQLQAVLASQVGARSAGRCGSSPPRAFPGPGTGDGTSAGGGWRSRITLACIARRAKTSRRKPARWLHYRLARTIGRFRSTDFLAARSCLAGDG